MLLKLANYKFHKEVFQLIHPSKQLIFNKSYIFYIFGRERTRVDKMMFQMRKKQI